MQTGTERQEAWVLLICEVIQILAAQKIGADAFDMRMFGSRVYEMALLDSDADEALISGRRSQQLARRWAFVFALLVPLQVIGYAWLWADSDSQLNRQINQGERGVAALRSRIQASRSEAELSSLLAAANPGPLPPLQGGSLAERKQQLNEAIAINTSRISGSLRDQRAETLRTSLPGTLRVLFGAAIVSAFLFMLRRQI
jgi:hypothetical protein